MPRGRPKENVEYVPKNKCCEPLCNNPRYFDVKVFNGYCLGCFYAMHKGSQPEEVEEDDGP